MKKIAIINACTDLGVNIDGAKLGATMLTQDLKSSKISSSYTLTANSLKENLKELEPNKKEINDYVKEFSSLLLQMHESHFESSMNKEESNGYYQKMHELVLAVKALDTKCEKRNLPSINQFNEELYCLVSNVLEKEEFPLTVGGDHIIAIASSLASLKKHQNLGIIWFDAHSDFNTYSTSVTGNLHGLPLAVATHYEKDILSDFHHGPFYNPQNTVVVGARDIDPWEWGNILDAGVTVFSTKDIETYGIQNICKKAFEIASKRYKWCTH
ncbi:MAG: hypothetical protein HFJ28_02315 [Clostridia bacterium]|nr:hypothetical protein [Clostridia bacterium]